MLPIYDCALHCAILALTCVSRCMAARLGAERSASTETADGPPSELRDALRDLDKATAEAREKGFPSPSDSALANVRRLLPVMYELLPCRFEVYPMPNSDACAIFRRGSVVRRLCERSFNGTGTSRQSCHVTRGTSRIGSLI